MDAPAPVHLKNVQTYQICVIHKRFWTKIQIDEEHKEVGTEGTE